MPYRFRRKESVKKGLRRIAREQIDNAVEEIDDPELDRHETVHQVRKRCKKIRGLIRLVRPLMEETYQQENAWFRDAAAELSYVRDAQSIIESFDKLIVRFAEEFDCSQFEGTRDALTARRRKITEDEATLDHRLQDFRERMMEARDRLSDWKLGEKGFDALNGGLRKTYQRGQAAMGTAYKTPEMETFHEWRKRVKYHWYHVRLLQSIWKDMMNPHCDILDQLSDQLGDEHDLAVLRETLLAEPNTFGAEKELVVLLGLIDRRRLELQSQAHSSGERLYAEKPKWLASRLGCYWDVWKTE